MRAKESENVSVKMSNHHQIVEAVKTPGITILANENNRRGPRQEVVKKEEPTEEEVQKQIRETLEKLQGKSNKSKGAKYRRDKRVATPSEI